MKKKLNLRNQNMETNSRKKFFIDIVEVFFKWVQFLIKYSEYMNQDTVAKNVLRRRGENGKQGNLILSNMVKIEEEKKNR